MAKFVIEGPSNLKGEIEVFGAKNAAMKMIAASVLISGRVILENVPDILDIETIINILIENGAQISRVGHRLEIDTTNLADVSPNKSLVEKMRGSIVLIGPYLSRFGKISLPKPGGCAIGSRPIDTHLNAFTKLGARVAFSEHIFSLFLDKNTGGEITLDEASVTATENIIMAQVLASGQTIVHNCATEPQITDLANFLRSAGAKIKGDGTKTITIDGVDKLSSTTYSVMPDPFEAATFICLGVASHSLLKISSLRPADLYPFLDKLRQMGVEFEEGDDYIKLNKTDNFSAINITTAIHPGFSTDMQAPFALLLTQAQGKSLLHETLYENRLGYLKELQQMGAKIKLIDAHRAEIIGPASLSGATIESLDLRAGATMILAGVIAKGETIIDKAEIVDRGYEKIEERLRKIGAKIRRIDE